MWKCIFEENGIIFLGNPWLAQPPSPETGDGGIGRRVKKDEWKTTLPLQLWADSGGSHTKGDSQRSRERPQEASCNNGHKIWMKDFLSLLPGKQNEVMVLEDKGVKD